MATDPPYRWDDGWFLSHEGGGCSAWRRWFPGGYVLLGDGDWQAPSIDGYRPRPSLDRDIPIPDAFVAALAALEVEVVVAVYLATAEGEHEWEEGAVPTGLVPLREALAAAEAAASSHTPLEARRYRTTETAEEFGLDGLDPADALPFRDLPIGGEWTTDDAGPVRVTITRIV